MSFVPVALITGAARRDSIAAGVVPRLVADGWDVTTSDLQSGDYPCDLSDPTGPGELMRRSPLREDPWRPLS